VRWSEAAAWLLEQRLVVVETHALDLEQLGSEAGEPWATFLKASDHYADLLEALEDNEIPAALDALDAIDALMPETAFSLFHRAFIARREGSEDDALELYQAAAEKAPQVGPIWSNLGSLHIIRGEREEAAKAFRKALELHPNDRTALEGLVSLRELVKLRSADPRQPNEVRFVDVPTFQKLAEQQVAALTDAEALFNYGDQLLREGTALQAAGKAFERSSELRPAQPKVMHALATVYRLTERVGEAREILQRYTQMYPQDPNGFLHLAETCHAMGDLTAEEEAIKAVLELDPNSQMALSARFKVGPGEHDPAKEDELAKFGAERNSWMAYILANLVARERGDHKASLRQVEKAYALAPEQEDVLLHYAIALGERKELGTLASIIRPAVESGRYTKRLDWHFANVLKQLGMTKDALAVLEKAIQGEVPDEFKQMVLTTMDAWKNRVTGCGVRLEIVGENFLQRPIVLTLPDGEDGGVLVAGGTPLPH
jgi:tetratricopeptide (TPR) repeat protein